MRMHVKTRTLAILAVMAAFSTVLTVLGTVISVNTVFFTAAAAFLVGIAAVYFGLGPGAVFFFVCLVLDFICNPNKLHVFLYMALALYILLSEAGSAAAGKIKDPKAGIWAARGIRLVVFALCYCPLIIFLPQILVSGRILAQPWFLPAALAFGAVAWVIYDLAYIEVKKYVHRHLGKWFAKS